MAEYITEYCFSLGSCPWVMQRCVSPRIGTRELDCVTIHYSTSIHQQVFIIPVLITGDFLLISGIDLKSCRC